MRDLGGHLDFTNRARVGTLSCRVKDATPGVAMVGALPPGFQVKLGLVRGNCIPAGLRAADASHVSASSLGAFRAAINGAVWSRKMPLANTPAVLDLLDGLVGVDPALHIIWVRFRMMRRYLAYFPDEDAREALAMTPCIFSSFLLLSWDGGERSWVRPSLPLHRMIGFSGSSVRRHQRLITTTCLFPPEGKR